MPGVVGSCMGSLVFFPRELQNPWLAELSGKGMAIEGDSPVCENLVDSRKCPQVPQGTWNPVGIWEDHPS